MSIHLRSVEAILVLDIVSKNEQASRLMLIFLMLGMLILTQNSLSTCSGSDIESST